MGFFTPIFDATNAIADTIETGVDIVTGSGDSEASETTESVNEGANEAAETTGQAAQNVFEGISGGIGAIKGFFEWIAGFGDAIKGTGEFTLEWGGDIIGAEQVGQFLVGVGGAIKGFFLGLATGLGMVQGFFGFLSTLHGIEFATFLIGFVMVALAVWVTFSGIPSGEILVVQSYVSDVGMSIGLGLFGLLLIFYTFMNVAGSLAMLGVGAIFLYVYKLGDERAFMLPGFFGTIIGMMMVTTSIFNFGAVLALIFSVPMPYLVITAPTIIGTTLTEFSSSVRSAAGS